MSYVPPAYEPRTLSGAELRDAVLAYATNPLYLDSEEWENDDNPYRRQLRPAVLRYLDFDKPLRRDQMFHYESLAAQRMLTCIYEADSAVPAEVGADTSQVRGLPVLLLTGQPGSR